VAPKCLFVGREVKSDIIFLSDARGRGEPEHNASKYPTAVAASAGEQLDTMHVDTLSANVLLLQMQLTSDLQMRKNKSEGEGI
jgi:hypothetical protein